MLKYRREFKFRRVHKSIWGAVALLLVFSFLLQNVAGSAYYSLVMEPNTTVASPPVVLQEGTAGNSTIYTNSTSAKVSVIASVTPPALIFESGFETGDFTEWTETDTATGCSITIVTSPRRDGSYAARSYTDDPDEYAVARKDFSQLYNTLFGRVYAQFTALPAADGDIFRAVYILHVATAAPWYRALAAAGIKNVAGTSKWYLQYRNGAVFSELTAETPLPEANRWYSIEIKAARSGTVGEARLWVDGTEILSATGLDNDEWTDNSRFEVGLGGDPVSNSTTIYVDSVKVAEAYIGPEAHYYDFVDNNASDVDSNGADKGTHGNFTAQQYGPDLINDTLTEENFGGEGGATPKYAVTGSTSEITGASDGNYATIGKGGTCEVTDYQGGTGTIRQVYFNITYYGAVSGTLAWAYQLDGGGWNNIENLPEGGSAGSPLTRTYNATSLRASWTWGNLNTTDIQFQNNDGASPENAYVDAIYVTVVTSPPNYELDLEVQWTSVDFDEPNEELSVYGETMSAENITIDVWNGSGWENLFTDLNSGWNNVSVSSYLTSSNFTIRFKGGNETGDTTQDTWDIDATLLHVWTETSTGPGDFNYVLNMTENDGSNWKIRLSAYNQSNIDRLKNCSIYIYDGSNSTQIIILNGTYNQQTGPWYDLAALDIEYIWMHVEVFGLGTSYVYVYLEILVPVTTTYAQYILTFKIT